MSAPRQRHRLADGVHREAGRVDDSQRRQGQRQHALGVQILPEEAFEKGMDLLLVEGGGTHRPRSMHRTLPSASSGQFGACLPARKMRGSLSWITSPTLCPWTRACCQLGGPRFGVYLTVSRSEGMELLDNPREAERLLQAVSEICPTPSVRAWAALPRTRSTLPPPRRIPSFRRDPGRQCRG
jgi:hypothetical protein